MCELANPHCCQKRRDHDDDDDDDDDGDDDNDSNNLDRDFHNGVEVYKLYFVQSGRPHEFCVMMYLSVAEKPILYAHRIQAVSVEAVILRFRALPITETHQHPSREDGYHGHHLLHLPNACVLPISPSGIYTDRIH
jgi:hypothetical protein